MLKVGATPLTTLIATQGVRAPRARDPGLRRRTVESKHAARLLEAPPKGDRWTSLEGWWQLHQVQGETLMA